VESSSAYVNSQYVDAIIKDVQRQARKQLVREVEEWVLTGKSVKQLIFRLKTAPLTYSVEE